MSRPNGFGSDPMLDQLIQARRGAVATHCWVRHPDGVFWSTFSAVTGEVDASNLTLVYRHTTRAIARHISAGRVRDVLHLHRLGVVILRTYAWHYRCRTWRRDNPRMPVVPGGPKSPLPLFTSRVQVKEVAGPERDPASELLRAERFPVLLRGARVLGFLGVRLLREYRAYEERFGKRSGAYPFLARLAIVGPKRQILKLRRSSPETDPGGMRPPTWLVQRVRKLHRIARRQLQDYARSLGYPVPFQD